MDAPSDYQLSDRYEAQEGVIHCTGVQALARIPIEQLRRDRRAGRNTAAFISGYPGSPLGGFDLELNRAIRTIGDELPIRHLPAVNEELGASAVMGSQLASERPDVRYDGIVGIWYGKAPGLDRATDALRHGVFAGSSSGGGALALVGDDPSAKSSTMPSSSDAALVDLHMPILYPANTGECLELGLHGIAMSRAAGLWSALKIVTAVADGNGTMHLPVLSAEPVLPTVEIDGQTWRQHPSAQFLGPRMVEVEREFHEIRTGLALDYGRLNSLNQTPANPTDAWLGIVATGFTFNEVLESFRRLGFPTLASIENVGIRLLNLRMPVPFDRELVQRFAEGVEEIFVVEEKNPTLERLVRDALYDAAVRPRVIGKDFGGEHLLPSYGRLDADHILPALRTRLEGRLGQRLAPAPPAPRERIPLSIQRAPYFCSGCPHNWGTKVPSDAVVGMGTGCHGMTLLMDEERVGDSIGITAMGNEGAQWLGMEPFVDTDHIFQNFGDGTYFHSGQLAVQAAIGAGVNVTFKILYNHTVAMTGGQDASHQVTPAALASILLSHGVRRVVITTDDPEGYRTEPLPSGVDVEDRRRIVAVQESLAAMEGVTVLIHDQACAAENRRARKRNLVATPSTRVVINHRICEGCGDCGDVSNCLSVQPFDTPLGRKTRIDQASCNIDLSCLEGDCPAFMTVEVGDQTPPPGSLDPASIDIEDPPLDDQSAVVVRLAGIGGTGVVTVAQVLGTAAMLAGYEVHGLDQTGLSQKAGPVVSDVTLYRSGREGGELRSNVAGSSQVGVLLAFDQLVAAADGVLDGLGTGAVVIASTATTPTGRQVTDPTLAGPTDDTLVQRLREATGTTLRRIDAQQAAIALVGSASTANMFILGSALQTGAIPVHLDSVRRAIELNGVAVEANLLALEWGRRWTSDPGAVEALVTERSGHPTIVVPSLPDHLHTRVIGVSPDAAVRSLVGMMAADLIGYQDEACAERFVSLVELAAQVEEPALTEAVARGFHKLLAYKDEYEVARLMLSSDGLGAAHSIAGARASTLRWHLRPPVLQALGVGGKVRFGLRSRPLFRALARGKRLRGTALDPFGRTELRRLERELVDHYELSMQRVLSGTIERGAGHGADVRVDTVRQLASLPDMIRGFEQLKMQRAHAYRVRFAELESSMST
jgi:indolepyruvate ferredoxin oxidoreductase